MLTEGASLFKRAGMMMVYTRKALGLERSPTQDEVLWWRPVSDTDGDSCATTQGAVGSSRRAVFRILPVALRGNAGRMTTLRGTL